MGNVVGIEIKTAPDFISSMSSKKLFRQATELSKNFKHHYVFIIGDIDKAIDKMNGIMRYKAFKKKYYHKNQYYGAFASLCQITTPITVKDTEEAWIVMDYIFTKSNDSVRRDLSPPEFKVDNPVITYLAGIRNINLKKASLISRELGLETLEDLLTVTKNQLLNINGIGDTTANLIIKAISK